MTCSLMPCMSAYSISLIVLQIEVVHDLPGRKLDGPSGDVQQARISFAVRPSASSRSTLAGAW